MTIQELRVKQAAFGATESRPPSSFGNDAIAWHAAHEGVAIADLTHWGLLEVKGEDRLQFLHNQSTNEIKNLKSGQGCETVLLTSTARTLELATLFATETGVSMLVSPEQAEPIMAWLDRYLFPMDRVELANISTQYAVFSLIGPQSDSLLATNGVENIIGQGESTHLQTRLGNIEVRIAVGNGLAMPGYTLIVAIADAAVLWQYLVDKGAAPLGDRLWEHLRICQGRPLAGRELTEDYNPLEAGLWRFISFDKGCYIGQETIARLNTYQGVKQQLWGVVLDRLVPLATPILVEDKKVGVLTSCAATEVGYRGLAYIRSRIAVAGLEFVSGEATGKLVTVPFLSHRYYQPGELK